MSTVRITAQDKSSTKRLEEILTVLKDKKAYKDITPQKAVEILEQLGPTFVKTGQLMSDRTDVIPKEYCDAFATLRDDSNPIPFDEILDILNENYAPRIVDDIFSAIEPDPIGSASIAQVHRAKLKDGTGVALKVRRPGIKETMEEDIELMQHLIAVAQLISKKHDNILLTVSGFVDEIAKTTQQEANLSSEMENLIRFQEELKNSGGKACGISSPTDSEKYPVKAFSSWNIFREMSWQPSRRMRTRHVNTTSMISP